MSEYSVVLITASTQEEAQKIGRTLVEERLFACSNLISPVQSIFHWEGKVNDENEVLIMAKTKTGLSDDIIKRVKELHSYTVPEILFLPILRGSEDYLNWVDAETRAVTEQNTDH
ncbi:MAG: divalent-cation tolerance protein CutA [Candidatus Brocadiales bacterium]|nr:divalent-cation tolerance protein CutA [Candidatus Bathyanammoxibius amoris]